MLPKVLPQRTFILFLLLFGTLFCTSLTILSGTNTNQEIELEQTDYIEGKLYVEIKDRYQQMNWEYNHAVDKPKNHGLRRWILQYQIIRIEQINTNKGVNAFYFYFKKTHLTQSLIHTLSGLPYIQNVAQISLSTMGKLNTQNSFTSNSLPNKVVLPTAFSPNNDGFNDYFKPIGENIESYEFQIFNRLGELICRINESSTFGWDGLVNGRITPKGIYAYYGWVRFEDGATKMLKGHLTLID
ncbi:MAG: T9SS type B sorting domain-containing protein [Chitinophagales bacterium]